MSELCDLDASRLSQLVRSREISPVESVQACLERIEALNGAVNAFVYICADRALKEARAQERAIARGDQFTRENLWVKRPGTGRFLAKDYETLLGRQAARDVPVNAQLSDADVVA